MKKASKKATETTSTEVEVIVEATAPATPIEQTTKQIGRPANPTSNRQLKIQERQAKLAAGLLKKGRPVTEGSKRQETLKKRNEKVSNGIELSKGRPVNPNSNRQLKLNKQKAVDVVSDIVELERGI